MQQPLKGLKRAEPNLTRLLAYVADLELEVDRLRRRGELVDHEVRGALAKIGPLCAGATADDSPADLDAIAAVVAELAAVLADVREVPGYHPAHDQVVAIAVRPLVEQVMRGQQRLQGAPDVALRLDLASEYVEWFPARLRHILDHLFSNALKYRDPDQTGAWVSLGLRVSPEGYEFCVSDNGIGLPDDDRDRVFDLFYRAAPARAAGLGVGLPVVKLLVEQSGGTLKVETSAAGTTFVVVLPRFEIDDFLV
jgi:signal transduction histidine kinase